MKNPLTRTTTLAMTVGVLTVINLLACIGLPDPDVVDDPDAPASRGPTETSFDLQAPSYLSELEPERLGVSTEPSACQALGYPCSILDVSDEVRMREVELHDQILEAHGNGDTPEQIASWLGEQTDVVYAFADQTDVSYRVEAGMPRVAMFGFFGLERGNDAEGLVPEDTTRATRQSRLVVDESSHKRRVKIATLPEWEGSDRALLMSKSLGPTYDEGLGPVGRSIDAAPSYSRDRMDVERIQNVNFDTPYETWLSPFRSWRDYSFLVVHAHGSKTIISQDRDEGHIFLVVLDVPVTRESLDKCVEYIEGVEQASSTPLGLVCYRFKEFIAIAITLDTLHALGSAPLKESIMYTTSCRFAEVSEQAMLPKPAGKSTWLLDKRAVAFGWDGLAQIGWADRAAAEVVELMLEDGLRTGDALERVVNNTCANNSKLKLREEDTDYRARHVVFFADNEGKAFEPEDTGLLELVYEDGRGWYSPLRVLFSGVLPEEVGMFDTSATVLTDQGTAYFEPSTFNPSTRGARPGVRDYDYIVPTEVVFGEEAPKHGDRVDMRVETELPEKGTSGIGGLEARVGALLDSDESKGYASFVVARPECAIATLEFGSGGGAGWHNANKVVTQEIPGAGLSIISIARATRMDAGTTQEFVQESAPGFTITLEGALPSVGESKTYAPEDITLAGTAIDGVSSSIYTASAKDGDGSVGLWLQRRRDGSLKGRLHGAALYPGGQELVPSRVRIEFISAPPNAPGDAYQCF